MANAARAAALAVAAWAFWGAPVRADRFEDSLAEARKNAATPGGQEYQRRVDESFEETKLRDALARCVADAREEDVVPFTALLRLSADGRASEVLLRPPFPIAVCLRWSIRETSFPRPPDRAYWVAVDVSPTRAAGVPPVPTAGVATATVPPTPTPAAPGAGTLRPTPSSPDSEPVIDFAAGAAGFHVDERRPDPSALRRTLAETRAKFVGPILAQSDGVALDDPRLDPYWSLAEELALPAVVRLGLEPPGADQRGDRYRVSLGDPLKLEAVLVRHPKLTLVVSGAAWPLGDAMTALMWKYPRVYVDTSVIAWWLPRREFDAYLKRLVDANLAEQILFASGAGSVERLAKATDAVRSAAFLTAEQKRAIFRGNAARLEK